MAKFVDPDELNILDLSDSSTVPGGNAAPSTSLRGSSSSAQQLASETSPCTSSMCWTAEERLQEFMIAQQIVTAKLIEEKEERLQKFMVEQQLVMAKMIVEKEERLQKFMVEQQLLMAKMNEEKEERLQKFMVEQQVVMPKIIADAVKDATGRRGRRGLGSPAQ